MEQLFTAPKRNLYRAVILRLGKQKRWAAFHSVFIPEGSFQCASQGFRKQSINLSWLRKQEHAKESEFDDKLQEEGTTEWELKYLSADLRGYTVWQKLKFSQSEDT